MCIYVYYDDMYVIISGGQRSTSSVGPQAPCTLYFWGAGSLIALVFTKKTSWPDSETQGSACFCLPSGQLEVCDITLALYMGPRDQT